ncbi:MAG: hypothetical protein XXXNARYT_003081, partial [Candidatus Accumulibacter regalis]
MGQGWRTTKGSELHCRRHTVAISVVV